MQQLYAKTKSAVLVQVTVCDRLKISFEMILMTNNQEPIKITINRQQLETVKQFKYLGAIINEEVLKTKVLVRAAQTTHSTCKTHMYRDKNISFQTKLNLLHALVLSLFLYAC